MKMSGDEKRFILMEPELGRGAFGTVYKAQDTDLNCLVAVKRPNSSEYEQALIKEAQTMMRINERLHTPYVVHLHDVHTINGRKSIVMELIEGGSLRKEIGRIDGGQKPTEPAKVLAIAIDVCSGLHVLHCGLPDEAIIHRDIKPENILMQGKRPVITDFGIARVIETAGIALTSAGTPPYMSPEQFTGRADIRADLYGLGVILYEMLAGRLPFPLRDAGGEMVPQKLYIDRICEGCRRSPEEFGVDAELAAIVLKAMHHKAQKRFQSALELQETLKDILKRLSPEDAIAEANKEIDPIKRERALRKVVERFPRYPRAYRELASCYNGQARTKDAVKVLEKGRRDCRENDGELLVLLAMGYNQLGMHRKAVEALEGALGCQLPRRMKQEVERLLQVTRRRQGC